MGARPPHVTTRQWKIKKGSVLQLTAQESIPHRLLLFWCSSSTVPGVLITCGGPLANSWCGHSQKLVEILDMRRNIKPNPRSTRVFPFTFALRFSQGAQWEKYERDSWEEAYLRRKRGYLHAPWYFEKSHQHSLLSARVNSPEWRFSCSKYRHMRE